MKKENGAAVETVNIIIDIINRINYKKIQKKYKKIICILKRLIATSGDYEPTLKVCFFFRTCCKGKIIVVYARTHTNRKRERREKLMSAR